MEAEKEEEEGMEGKRPLALRRLRSLSRTNNLPLFCTICSRKDTYERGGGGEGEGGGGRARLAAEKEEEEERDIEDEKEKEEGEVPPSR